MEPVKRMNLKEMVIAKLQAYVEEHRLQPGDRFLSEREIIARFGVSRTVVREALQALEAVGVIRIRPGDGIFVQQFTLQRLAVQYGAGWAKDAEKMMELLETRYVLECAAIDLVLKRMRKDEAYASACMEEWNESLARMGRAIAEELPIVEEDLRFHRSLFRMTGNESFSDLSEVVTQYFNEIRSMRLAEAAGKEQTLRDHRDIVDCLSRRDGERAKRAMEQHLYALETVIAEQ